MTRLTLGRRRARKRRLLPKAQELRRLGLSAREIGNTLHISDWTVLAWTKGVPKGNIFKDLKQ